MEPNTKLGHYKILEPLGAGGMGEVYRARDTKLERDVAIKVLPENFAADPDRLARFEREAKLLAQLNHPNIAGIHGFDDANGVWFIAMEVVEGETLGERLATTGRLDVKEALGIARQIAEAFEAAHEAGIIHRDLKPANVKITPEGKVKVLDFGLAKAYEADGSASSISPELSASPTIAAATRTGVILGTAAYMSPEQARGNRADKRTDIWAFGALLYEMLTGSRPFQGETVSDTLASILKEEPHWNVYPVDSLGKVRALLRRCLRKDPGQRLHDIADARIEIEEMLADPDALAGDEPGAAQRAATPWLAGGVAGAVLATLVLTVLGPWFRNPSEPPPPTLTSHILLPEGQTLTANRGMPGLALSPGGGTLVYVAADGTGRRLYARSADGETRAIPGSEGAHTPFFSPDGGWLAFVAQETVWKIRLDGERPVPVAEGVGRVRGATWAAEDTIILGAYEGGLRRVSATGGGEPETITSPSVEEGSFTHRLPHALPDGESVLFTVYKGGANDDSDIALLSLETLDHTVVFTPGTFPRYATSGHLLFGREPSLFATAIDLASWAPIGTTELVVADVNQQFAFGGMQYATSDTGTLVYEPYAYPPRTELVLVDEGGGEQVVPTESTTFGAPRFSPDRRYIAAEVTAPPDRHILTHDLDRGRPETFVVEGNNQGPVWSPDSSAIIFGSNRLGPGGFWQTYLKTLGEARDELRIGGFSVTPQDWRQTPEGEFVILQVDTKDAARNIAFVRTIDQPGELTFVADTPFSEQAPRLSPNGRWIVYQSDQSGIPEAWVADFPDATNRVPVSIGGGFFPAWSPGGDRIYYRTATHLMSVEFGGTLDDALPSPATVLDLSTFVLSPWDIHPDGNQFVFVRNVDEPTPRDRLVLITNWFDKLARDLPTGR